MSLRTASFYGRKKSSSKNNTARSSDHIGLKGPYHANGYNTDGEKNRSETLIEVDTPVDRLLK